MDLSNPTNQAIIGGVIRSLLVAAGATGCMSGDQLGALAGALAVIVGLGWSIWQKRKSAATGHATLETAVNAAVASPQDATDIIAAAKAGKF